MTYYQFTNDGIKDNEGQILYTPAGIDNLRKVIAQESALEAISRKPTMEIASRSEPHGNAITVMDTEIRYGSETLDNAIWFGEIASLEPQGIYQLNIHNTKDNGFYIRLYFKSRSSLDEMRTIIDGAIRAWRLKYPGVSKVEYRAAISSRGLEKITVVGKWDHGNGCTTEYFENGTFEALDNNVGKKIANGSWEITGELITQWWGAGDSKSMVKHSIIELTHNKLITKSLGETSTSTKVVNNR